MRRLALLSALLLLAPAGAENLIRNGGFELPFEVGTTKMLQGQEPMQYHWGDGRTMFISWQPIGPEAWWSVGLTKARQGIPTGGKDIAWVDPGQFQMPGVTHSGQRALCLRAADKPVGAVCGAGQILPPGKLTCSLWVLSRGATGRVRFDCLPDNRDMSAGFLQETAAARAELPLPTGMQSEWRRLVGTIDVPAGAPQQLAVRLQVDKGVAFFDDVQVEAGDTATEFNLRPAEQVTVHLNSSRALPVLVEGRDKALAATIGNSGRQALDGELTVGTARWDGRERRVGVRKTLASWKPGATLAVSLPLTGLRPDAYVVFARLERAGEGAARRARQLQRRGAGRWHDLPGDGAGPPAWLALPSPTAAPTPRSSAPAT